MLNHLTKMRNFNEVVESARICLCYARCQFIVAWHCAIPTEWEDGSPLLRNYKLWLKLLDPCDNKPGFCGADVMVERNIIIRD